MVRGPVLYGEAVLMNAGQKSAADVAALLRARNPLLWIVSKEEGRLGHRSRARDRRPPPASCREYGGNMRTLIFIMLVLLSTSTLAHGGKRHCHPAPDHPCHSQR